MKLCSPFLRPLAGAALAALAIFFVTALPAPRAHAQPAGIPLIDDTEAQRVLRGYLDPILTAAGIVPGDVHLYLVNDDSVNAFVAEGQNMFINTGLLTTLDTPNQVTGVMAHETGHIVHGDLVRANQTIHKAMIPILLSTVAGIAAMALGAGPIGALIMGAGQQVGMQTYLGNSRTVEADADQAGVRLLTATHQSGEGMLRVFKRFEDEEVLSSRHIDPYAQTHPAPRERIDALQALVDASPYRDIKDSPEAQYAYDMLRAKLRGYLERPDVVLRQYPESDTSKPARYARAMAYFRVPDMQKALGEIESLLKDEPENPYFLEMDGQIKVEMGHVAEGIEPYRHAVRVLPDAPLIRTELGAALLGTDNPQYGAEALQQLKTAIDQNHGEDTFAWYELSQAYGQQHQVGMAELATAEQAFRGGGYRQAVQFAVRAQRDLPQGSRDAQRADDIVAVAQSQMANERN